MSHARRNAIPYLALLWVLVVGAGGGYAFAASKSKTITVCADKKTGILHLKKRGRCKRTQTKVTWNQRGPQGQQGLRGTQGPAGPAGASAVSIWADVANNGAVIAGQGLSVTRLGAGTYQVTVTAPACAHGSNAPVITVSDTYPPGGQVAGAFPVAWFQAAGGNQVFDVFTGVVPSGGHFGLSDHSFDVIDSCM